MGMILLTVGVVLATFSIQEFYTEENTFNKWDDIGSSIAYLPDSGPSWALDMQKGNFFELNVSASDTVSVRIGNLTYDEDMEHEVLTDLVFDQIGTGFTQKVAISANDTYGIKIKNAGTSPVRIWGNVLAKENLTIHKMAYPYSSLGTLVGLVGLTSLTYGAFTKPKKRRT